ncbi:hypothetical protein SAMN05443244_0070 [Terriglobus roseus]|uniref:Uncharacterized protein n=1 Tax=Terriglobus roseus TaxID=392734 RepID=A0A1H4IV21_9BACT|nr:hypothetical protein SAMN05443244_0070 [Terriglobus roseus]
MLAGETFGFPSIALLQAVLITQTTRLHRTNFDLRPKRTAPFKTAH